MSLHAKIEAVIYASEEPVTLQQLVSLLAEEAAAELDAIASQQGLLALDGMATVDGGGAPDEQTGSENAASGAEGASQPAEDEQTPSAEPLPDTAVADGTDAVAAEASDAVPAEPADGMDSIVVSDAEKRQLRERERAVRDHIRRAVDRLVRDYAESDRGIEIREVASGYRMATKPEYHDAVRGFIKGLKPALKLTLPALETLAVVAYKQPVTAAELSEIRGVDSAGVLGGLLARKLIATAGRKQVIGRPMLYKTTRDFLLRFGLRDVNELPSMDEFERMASELVEPDESSTEQTAGIVEQANVRGDAEHIRQVTGAAGRDADSSDDAGETDDTDESDDALEAEAAALASDGTATDQATAETAAGGDYGRNNESAQAAPLHTTEASDAVNQQASESAGGEAPTGEEAERVGSD